MIKLRPDHDQIAGAADRAAATRYCSKFSGRKVCLVATGANVDDGLRQEIISDHG
jgi:threonine dehydratase